MTNANEIRAMSDEKLAEFFCFVAQDAFCYGRGMREKMLLFPFGNYEDAFKWMGEEADNG